MSNIIEDFYFGNIKPQELNSELTPEPKKKLSSSIVFLLCINTTARNILYFNVFYILVIE